MAVRYILRDAAREIEGGGLVSNIGREPDTIASFFAALEELEFAGRANANVYTGVIVSLPHELDGTGRETLLREICRPLVALDLPYAAVLHAPDPEGNPLNFHAHVMFSWRQFAVLPDGFSFATHTLGSLNQTDFVTDFRDHAAAAMNKAMVTAGHPRRFTAKKRDRKNADVSRDKHSAGRKHADRRLENIALGTAERAWVDERSRVLAHARTVVEDLLLLDITGRCEILAKIENREAELVLQQRHALEANSLLKPQLEMTPSLVSHEKSTAIGVQSHEDPPAHERLLDQAGKPTSHSPADAAKVSSTLELAIKRAGIAWRAQLFAAPRPGSFSQASVVSLATAPALRDIPSLSEARATRAHGLIRLGDARPKTTVAISTPALDPITKNTPDKLSTRLCGTSPPPLSQQTLPLVAEPANEQRPIREQGLAPLPISEDENIDAIITHLHAMNFLPLRPITCSENRTGAQSFGLIHEKARPEDAAALRQAAALDDERINRFYRERWMAMLERVRALLTSERKTKLPAALADALKRGDARAAAALEAEGWDPQLVAAVRAAGKSSEIAAIVDSSDAYWRERVRSRLPAPRTSVSRGARRVEVERSATEPQVAEDKSADTDLDLFAAYMKDRGRNR